MADSGASPLPRTSSENAPAVRAERFLRDSARVLEQRLFAHHFRDGAPAPVEAAVDAHLDDDGGYGWALEPGLRGPAGRTAHTARALYVLDAVGRLGGGRAERVCRWLTSVSAPDGGLPAPGTAAHAPTAAHAFAPPRAAERGSLLVTGPVAGLLHRGRVWHAWLFRATDFCWGAVESLAAGAPEGTGPDLSEVEAAVMFLDAVPDRARAEAAAARLGALVRERRPAPAFAPAPALAPVPADAAVPGAPAAAPVPRTESPAVSVAHVLARTPDSPARAWFTRDEMAHSLDVLAAGQRPDGGWPERRAPWSPAAGPGSRPAATIDALRTLRAHGRPVG
ncbi:hypothetical protein ACIQU5_13215 [Streptomyces sp. NPDC090306]|uniref:hypothetical protein n=1 Tax=Streptomyces sp. NPDC090306 TaxID=3365961 RepID=UPI00380A9A14